MERLEVDQIISKLEIKQMRRLTRRAEADGVRAVWYGDREVFLEGEPGYEEANKLAMYEDLEEIGKPVLYPNYAYFIKDGKVMKGWVQQVVHTVSTRPLYDIRYDDHSLANYRGYLNVDVFLTEEAAQNHLNSKEGDINE